MYVSGVHIWENRKQRNTHRGTKRIRKKPRKILKTKERTCLTRGSLCKRKIEEEMKRKEMRKKMKR